MLEIFNSLTKRKEIFKPIDPNNVRMYVCGMTVYDYCHLGHARVLMVFDVVYRVLRQRYGEKAVTYVRNITDIDDNIIKRAKQNDEPYTALTHRFIDEMNKDADALGVLRPNLEPRATAYIEQIVAMIEQLVERGYAYAASNGDVYYSVAKFEGYGKLSGRNMEDERAGARVEIGEAKRDPLDFVLWKAAKPGEPQWDSPWGVGRPGWHIECSAMSTHCLGNHFDIHGGGMDLKFPHHENEIAQTEGATGEHFVNLWMHNGYITVAEEKMSKSLGNFFTIRDVLKIYDPEVIRYFILASHYRSPLSYSDDNLNQAKSALERLYTALRDTQPVAQHTLKQYAQKFDAALDDDFNTADALAVLFELAKETNKAKSHEQTAIANEHAGCLKELASVLGILQNDPEIYLKGRAQQGGLSDEAVNQLIQQRLDARAAKDWKRADEIRNQLTTAGIVLEDGKSGTSWKRA